MQQARGLACFRWSLAAAGALGLVLAGAVYGADRSHHAPRDEELHAEREDYGIAPPKARLPEKDVHPPQKFTPAPLEAPGLPAEPPAGDDAEPAEERDDLEPLGAREELDLAGIDESHFNQYLDGEPFTQDEEEVTLKVLYRVRNFDPVRVSQWTQRKYSERRLAAAPEYFRAQMFALVGRLENVELATPPAEVVDRLEMEHYYICRVRLDSGRIAIIVTTRVPRAWPLDRPLNERVTAAGLLLKVGTHDQGQPQLVFAAHRLAWHPDQVRSADEGPPTNLGMTVLADLGMDVGHLEDVVSGQRIRDEEREPFYQMLWAMKRATPAQLERFALLNLNELRESWRKEVAVIGGVLKAQRESGEPPSDEEAKEFARLKTRAAVLKRSIQEADKGVFSVFPLFNMAAEQSGQLVMLEGEARRALEIHVGSGEEGSENYDIVRRFGIERYYEIEMFTRDSQNNPLVFCVLELPEGFPLGEDIRERVRISGFFFKTWAYYSQKSLALAGPDERLRKQQLAPLMIAREPVWMAEDTGAGGAPLGIVAGGLFVAALLLVWYSLWRVGRSDRDFREKNIAKRYAPQDNASLNDLQLESQTEPDFSHLE